MPCSPEYSTVDNQGEEDSTQKYLLNAVIDARDKSEKLEIELLTQKDRARFWEQKATTLELKEFEARSEMIRWKDLESVARIRGIIAEKKILELERESEESFNYGNGSETLYHSVALMQKLLKRMEVNIKKQEDKNQYYLNMARTLSLLQDQTDEWNIYQGQMIERLQKELKKSEDVNGEQKKILGENEERILKLEEEKRQFQKANKLLSLIVVFLIVGIFIRIFVF